MAGEARTSSFVLSSATVMIGAMGDLWDLNPDDHSIGLVKNFVATTNPTYVDLTQGPKGTVVYSVMTANPVQARMEVYEFTSANMKWALGLEGKGVTAPTAVGSLKTALTGSNPTPVTTATFDAAADLTGTFPSGSWIMLQDASSTDHVHVAKLSGATTKSGSAPYTHTLTFANQGLKTGNDFPVASVISVMNTMDIGIKDEQEFFSAKVVGVLPEDTKPFTLLFPKIRILRGFNVSFTTDNFANMPFEFQPYELLPGDTNYGSNFPGVAKLFAGT